MILKPKVRGFLCTVAHPNGCFAHVQEQIALTKKQSFSQGPKKVLIIGASTGYGLSSRIVASFGYGAATLGVSYERPPKNGRTASAGWYNNCAFERAAHGNGLYAKNIDGDAFSSEIKEQTLNTLQNDVGPVDLVIYSLAAPKRTDPSGQTYRSTLKPIGQSFSSKTIDTDKKCVNLVHLEPATEEEILGTIKVMGGEDWELWIKALQEAKLLAPGVKTVAYSYIGPDITHPIYLRGTIGRAKEDLMHTAKRLETQLKPLGGHAHISVNKAVVTQASSAIPVVPLYLSILLRVMRERRLEEGCIEQMQRLFRDHLYSSKELETLIRVDDWEMKEEVQTAIKEIWPKITTENLDELADFSAYKKEFLKLFGFGLQNVDYEREVELND